MIHLTSDTQVLLAAQPVDFRFGIDGLAGLCEHIFKKNPRSGTLFVFISRDKTKVRILAYEDNGYWLMTKRISGGKFDWPKSRETLSNIQAVQLRKILSGLVNTSTELSNHEN